MASMRRVIWSRSDAAASRVASSAPVAARARFCSRSKASLASDNSSAIASAANRTSVTSPACPSSLANSPTLASTYCARLRSRGSCPSAQTMAKSRPLILTTSWVISLVRLEQLVEPAHRRVDAARQRRSDFGNLAVTCCPRCRIRRRFQPSDSPLQPLDGLGKLVHARARLVHLLVLLQRADVGRARHVREKLRPLRPGHLADIKIAARVDGEPVRPEKSGRRGAGMRVAKAGQQLALVVHDADPRAEIGAIAVDPHHRPQFSDIADGLPGVVHV